MEINRDTATYDLAGLHEHMCAVPRCQRSAPVSLHDCPCEWRRAHMASGESNLTTLQTLLSCNVTPTWLMTYYHPPPPLSQFHISLYSSSPFPFSSVLLPLCMLCLFLSIFLSLILSLCCDFCCMCIKHTLWGSLGGPCAEKWMPRLWSTRGI